MSVGELLIVCGIPSAVVGFCIWYLKNYLVKRESKLLERENNQEKLMLMLMQSNRASIILSEATAKAVQRIPDAHCNGDMHKALEYAAEVQRKQKDFLMELGVHSIYE